MRMAASAEIDVLMRHNEMHANEENVRRRELWSPITTIAIGFVHFQNATVRSDADFVYLLAHFSAVVVAATLCEIYIDQHLLGARADLPARAWFRMLLAIARLLRGLYTVLVITLVREQVTSPASAIESWSSANVIPPLTMVVCLHSLNELFTFALAQTSRAIADKRKRRLLTPRS